MTDLGIVDDEDASYLDIDHILMEEQKLSCQAKLDLIDLDFRRQKEGNTALLMAVIFFEANCYFTNFLQTYKKVKKLICLYGWLRN